MSKRPKNKKKQQKASADRFVEKNWKVLLIGLFLLAGVIRVWHISNVVSSDLRSVHLYENTDSHFFQQWANEIKAGDLLTNQELHPFHDWHPRIASSIIKNQNVLNDEEKLNRRAKKIWNEWYGGKRFHQEPFYPYFLAALQSIFGSSPFFIFFVQTLISLLSLWFIIQISIQLFDRKSALLAGFIFALYGPAVFFDGVMLRASIVTCATLACLYFCERAIRSDQRKWSVYFGLAAGVSLTIKSTFILLIIMLVAYLAFKKKNTAKAIQKFILPASLGIMIMTSPIILRNIIVGAPIFSSSSVGAVTYINSNLPEFNPYAGFGINFQRTPELMSESQGKLLPAITGSIATFDSFFGFVGLQFKKLGAVFHHYEIPNNVNFYFYRNWSLPLKLAFFTFPLLLLLGIFGMIKSWRSKPGINSLHLAILFNLSILIGFYVIARFKLSLAVILIPYAGYGLASLLHLIQERKIKGLVWLLPGLVLFLLSLRPIPNERVKIRNIDVIVPFRTEGVKRLDQALESSNREEILKIYGEYAATCPNAVLRFSKDNQPRTPREQQLTQFYANVYDGYSQYAAEFGRGALANDIGQIATRLKQSLQ